MTLIPLFNKRVAGKYFYLNSIVLAQGGDFRIQFIDFLPRLLEVSAILFY